MPHYTEVESDYIKHQRKILSEYKNVEIVALTLDQMTLASHGAALHIAHNIANGVKPRRGAPERGPMSLGISHLGMWAEVGVAQYLNLSWGPSLNKFGAKDVGGAVQVRTTYRQRDRSLILHEEDADNDPFVAAVVIEPVVYLLGWCLAKAGKLAEYWLDPTKDPTVDQTDKRPAYFVPNKILKPMGKLKEETYAKRLNAVIVADEEIVAAKLRSANSKTIIRAN